MARLLFGTDGIRGLAGTYPLDPKTAHAVGAALAARCFELGWVTRLRDTRALRITENGKCGFGATFGVEPAA